MKQPPPPSFSVPFSCRWKCGFAVCSLVLLVVLCNCMGLFLGVVGLKPKVEPTMRSQTSNCGGTFFLAWVFYCRPFVTHLLLWFWWTCLTSGGGRGSGFSFIFSWILMIVVLVLFFVTGNIYTLVCRPLRNGKLLEVSELHTLNTECNVTLCCVHCRLLSTGCWFYRLYLQPGPVFRI